MNRRSKVAMLLLLVVIVSFWLVGCVQNKEPKVPSMKNGKYVYDDGKVIKNEDEKNLNNLLEELDCKTDARLFVVTVKKLGNITIEEYADRVFEKFSLSKLSVKSEYDNALLVFDKNEKTVLLKTTSGLKEIPFEKIQRKCFQKYIDKDSYSEAVEDTAKTTLYFIADLYDADITNLHFTSLCGNPFFEFGIIIAVLISSLLGIIFLTNKERR